MSSEKNALISGTVNIFFPVIADIIHNWPACFYSLFSEALLEPTVHPTLHQQDISGSIWHSDVMSVVCQLGGGQSWKRPHGQIDPRLHEMVAVIDGDLPGE